MRIVDLKIEDIAFGGKGVGRESGKAVFVPYVIESELVSAAVVREKKQFAEAELVDVKKPSPHRVTPPCPYFGRCGGCSYQHIDYEHQLELKTRQVEQILKRIGHLAEIPMRPIVSSPQPYGYRNRVTVHCEDGVIGFYRRDEHRLIDIECCPISMREVNDELKKLREQNPRDGHYTLRAHMRPRVFSQTNDAVAELLLEHVRSLVPEQGALLIDAYCGAGFFAKHLLDKFDHVVGIDWDKFATVEARKNATEKETYIAGDVDSELQSRSGDFQIAGQPKRRSASFAELRRAKGDRRSLTLIIDPPATGLTSAGRRAIADLSPTTFIYVSCNPPTLARDLGELREHFTIESVTPFDMFPQTAEIEVAVKLSSRSSVEPLATSSDSQL